MLYLIGIIVVIIIVFLFMKLIKSIFIGFIYIITLGFLPSGIERLGFDHPLFDGKISTVVIPLIGHIINFFNVFIINAVDFVLYFLSYIPLIN